MVNRKNPRAYDKEFKNEAVRLVLEEDHKAAEVEQNLWIGANIVSRWARKSKENPDDAIPGEGRLEPPDGNIAALKRELERFKREVLSYSKGSLASSLNFNISL